MNSLIQNQQMKSKVKNENREENSAILNQIDQTSLLTTIKSRFTRILMQLWCSTLLRIKRYLLFLAA